MNNISYDDQAYDPQMDRRPSSQHGLPQPQYHNEGSDDDVFALEAVNQDCKPVPSSQRLKTPSDSSPGSSAAAEFGADPLAPEHFPTVAEFDAIVKDYLDGLSQRKREKALITQKMYDDVLLILRDPRNTATTTAQFRFWAKKMFAILEYKGEHVVTHDKRPVAVKEQIYDVLVYCHGQASHGGRDKTSSMTREYYSWVPKQLVAEFVKKCPTCLQNRQKHPNFFGEAHAPISQMRKPIANYSEPAPGVPQTITLQDARLAAKTQTIPKATGFFTRNDENDYAYPGSNNRRKGSNASSAGPTRNVHRPGGGGKESRHSFGPTGGAPYDELEQHRREMERRNYLDPELEFRPHSAAGSFNSHHSSGGGFDLDRAAGGSSSTLNSPAIQTPNGVYGGGLYNQSYPVQSYLSLPNSGAQRLSVPELYAQQQQQQCGSEYSSSSAQAMMRRGSTGGMMGGDGQNQQQGQEMMQAHHHQMQHVASDGGYFGQNPHPFQNNQRPVSAGASFPSGPSNDDLANINDYPSGGIVFADPFAPLPTSTSTEGIHRAHRPPPLNLNLNQQPQFSAYRSLPLDSAGLDSAGLLSAQMGGGMHHHQQRQGYLYSPLNGGFDSPGLLSLPNSAGGRPGSSAGANFPDGFGASVEHSRPGSAVFRSLGNQVEALCFDGQEDFQAGQQHQNGEQEGGQQQQQQQFAFSLDDGCGGGVEMQAEDSGVAWGGQQEDEEEGEGDYVDGGEQHQEEQEMHQHQHQQEAIEA